MSIRKKPNARAGFSLVEFLMVAIILGVGLLGLAALTSISVRGLGGSRTSDTATSLANSVLDRLTLDGRLSASLRQASLSLPPTALLANATDGNLNSYADPFTNLTTFDLQGQPSATAPVFTVTWVRLAPKSALVPVATSQSAGAEVAVNVQWSQAVRNPASGVTTVKPHYISVSRYVRY